MKRIIRIVLNYCIYHEIIGLIELW